MRRPSFAIACLLAAAPALADDPPKSPSCALLTAADAQGILGHSVMNGDDTAEAGGASSCAWVDNETFNAIGISLMRNEALAGVSAEETIANQKNTFGGMGAIEDIPDLGVPAFLITPTGVPEGTYMVSLGKNGQVVGLNVTGVPKDKTIAAAKLVAGKL